MKERRFYKRVTVCAIGLLVLFVTAYAQAVVTALNGGWLVLHDYFSEETPGVARAVDEAFQSHDIGECQYYRADQLAIVHKSSGSTTPDGGQSAGAATAHEQRIRRLRQSR